MIRAIEYYTAPGSPSTDPLDYIMAGKISVKELKQNVAVSALGIALMPPGSTLSSNRSLGMLQEAFSFIQGLDTQFDQYYVISDTKADVLSLLNSALTTGMQ